MTVYRNQMHGKNNAQGLGGGSKVGKGTPSSNDFLGIDKRVQPGSLGARQTQGDQAMGTEVIEGDPNNYRGESVGTPKQIPRKSKGFYGGGEYQKGTIGSRERMRGLGGEENQGIVGGLDSSVNVADATSKLMSGDNTNKAVDVQPGGSGYEDVMTKYMGENVQK